MSKPLAKTTEAAPEIMSDRLSLSPEQVAEIGQFLYGDRWEARIGPASGGGRNVGYNWRKEGAKGQSAGAILGLLARRYADQQAEAQETLEMIRRFSREAER